MIKLVLGEVSKYLHIHTYIHTNESGHLSECVSPSVIYVLFTRSREAMQHCHTSGTYYSGQEGKGVHGNCLSLLGAFSLHFHAAPIHGGLPFLAISSKTKSSQKYRDGEELPGRDGEGVEMDGPGIYL